MNNNNLEKAFKNIGDSDSLDFLGSKITSRIGQIQEKRNKIKVIISRTVGSISFVTLFPIFINTFNQLHSSGFWNYFSLLFTDTGVVATYWKEFLLSLADSLPTLQLSLILLLTLSLFVSLRFALKDFKKIGLSANLA